jgi:uncharacterized protein (DUF2384 family)
MSQEARSAATSRIVALLDALCTVYTTEGIGMWLYGRHKLLGNQRPIDLLRDGEIERVEQVVEQLTTGAFV